MDKLNLNNNKKKKIAKIYDQNINNKKIVKLRYYDCVYHQYVILSRYENKIIKLFKRNKIQYGKHYPKPIHKLKGTIKLFLNQSYKMQSFF